LLPGVEALLVEAQGLGLGRAVASSSSRAWVLGWLARHGIGERFQVVCGRDDVAQVKPAPDLFLLAAERLGIAPAACLVFEDSPNGMRAARAAGVSRDAWTAAPSPPPAPPPRSPKYARHARDNHSQTTPLLP